MMTELISDIQVGLSDLRVELDKARNNNKAAAARARKLSLSLEKLFKQFRKESVKM